MPGGLTVEVTSFDDYVVEFRVCASNGNFSGSAHVYATQNTAAEIAKKFAGFPTSRTDVRSIELGTFDKALAGGGARLQLSTLDELGHCRLLITLRADPRFGPASGGNAEFSVVFEPASLDRFLSSLAGFGSELGGKAHLAAG